MSWHHIVSAVKHEMFPKMGTTMDAVINDLENEDEMEFHGNDLGKKAVETVIEGMKEKRKMTASQVTYIEGLVERAKGLKHQS